MRKLAAATAAAATAMLSTGPNLVVAARPLAGSVRFLDHHGRVLPNVQLYLIYWGTAWTASTTSPTAGQITGAVQTMLASAYLTELTQYRGAGRGVVRGSAIITASDPPHRFTDRQVRSFLTAGLDAGTVPAPDADGQTLYGVVMPVGVASGEDLFDGEHDFYTRRGQRIHFLWTASSSTLESATRILSHEVVEAATDPEGHGFRGVPGACGQDGWCEIADVCSGSSVPDGITVTSYWSNRAGRCVVPERPERPAPAPRRHGTTGNPAAAAAGQRRTVRRSRAGARLMVNGRRRAASPQAGGTVPTSTP